MSCHSTHVDIRLPYLTIPRNWEVAGQICVTGPFKRKKLDAITFSPAPYVSWKHSRKLTGSIVPLSQSDTIPDTSPSFEDPEDDETKVWLLESTESPCGVLSVVEIGSKVNHELAGARILYLESEDLAQSIQWKDKVWTQSYYDDFATLPAIIPDGPVAILGLGAGTGAHILLHEWPHLNVEAWEINPSVVTLARKYFGLRRLEKSAKRRKSLAGRQGLEARRELEYSGLTVHVGDALNLDPQKFQFAGIVVDLFNGSGLVPELQDASVWRNFKSCLVPGGRILVNCGGIRETTYQMDTLLTESVMDLFGISSVVNAINYGTCDKVCHKVMQGNGENLLLLTGTLPDVDQWKAASPLEMREGLELWNSAPFVRSSRSSA